jgi:hypothetical protein
MSIMSAAEDHELARVERLDPGLRALLDHVAAELVHEYIQLMEPAASCEPAAATSATDA